MVYKQGFVESSGGGDQVEPERRVRERWRKEPGVESDPLKEQTAGLLGSILGLSVLKQETIWRPAGNKQLLIAAGPLAIHHYCADFYFANSSLAKICGSGSSRVGLKTTGSVVVHVL